MEPVSPELCRPGRLLPFLIKDRQSIRALKPRLRKIEAVLGADFPVAAGSDPIQIQLALA